MIRKGLRQFAPAFLDPVDRILLLNYPTLWILRVHYVVFFGLLGNLIVVLLLLLFPLRLYHIGGVSRIYVSLNFLSFILALVWYQRQSLYSVEKQFGHTSVGAAFWRLVGGLLCVVIIVSPAICFRLAADARFSAMAGVPELERDAVNLANASRFIGYERAHDSVDVAATLTLARKYTGEELPGPAQEELFTANGVLDEAVANAMGIDEFVSGRNDVEVYTMAEVFMVSLVTLGFLLNYATSRALIIALMAVTVVGTVLLAAGAFFGGIFDTLGFVLNYRVVVVAAIGLCDVAMLLAFLWSARQPASSLATDVSVVAFGLMLLLSPEYLVLALASGEGFVFDMIIALLPFVIFSPLLHRQLVRSIALPRR